MYLAFFLSMPNCGSWNGKWSGDGSKYVVVKKFFTKKQLANANSILNTGYYRYSWDDGWTAGITVKEVDSKQAAKLRKESQGFYGYEWMVDTIVDYGKPLANHEIEDFLNNKKISSQSA